MAKVSEQDRADAIKKQLARFEGQVDLIPDRLVDIDETRARPTWPIPTVAPRAASACPWESRIASGG